MIYYPKVYGICTGAKRAIDISLKIKNEFKDKNIYIYKEILHNNYVNKMLNDNGIKIIEDYSNLKKDDILILRAHGEGKNTYEELEKRKIKYFDATCVNVKRVHDIVEKKYNEKYKIIIVGKKTHPEVIGTNGWCNNEAIIIENENDYNLLNKNEKYFLVSQTTASYDFYMNTINYLEKNKYDFKYENTICNMQKLIQSSSVDLAKKMNLMIVIGGKNSSNTKELFNECSKVCKSYFFSEIKDYYDFIKKTKITSKTKIGFTGGASTLKDEILEYSSLLEFMIYYKESKKKIEKEVIKLNKSLNNKNNNKIVNDSINKLINMNSDGKYIRATLINLGYNLFKNDNYALALCASYETFETSILIHDDIIDNSPLRRGKKTIHYSYKDEFKNYELDNTPENLALCIGDLGFYYVNSYLIKKYKNDKNFIKLFNYYNNIVIDTIKGEIIDVYLPYIEKNNKNHILNEEDILEIYRLKTSKYTIVGPFILGLLLAGCNNKLIKEFESILEPIGISFQIKDDILGIFSDTNTIGKPVYSDIEEFKQTILYSYIKINKKEYLNDLLKIYGKKNINNNEYEKIKEILIKSGSLEYAQNIMENLFNESTNKIKELKIKENIKNILLGFITYLRLRNK